MFRAAPRLSIWKEVVWRPWLWVLSSAYAVLGFYQTAEWLTGWRLPNILPAFPGWLWALVGLVLFIMVILEGAYRSVCDRDRTIGERDQAIADRVAAEPALEVVFDPKCGACYGESGTQIGLGVWNKGAAAEDVHVYLSSFTPGPALGKLELSGYGDGLVGRRINPSIPSGHHHFYFLVSSAPREPYYVPVGATIGPLSNSRPYVAGVLVEGSNLRRPVLVNIEVDGNKDPPVGRIRKVEL
jgi:hypothetical protein